MPLQRDAVARTALALLDSVGLDGLTMRRLAEELGVQNPALYWHFRNKQDLLDHMAAAMLADALATIEPPDATESWAEWLAGVARAFRAALLSYRDGARVIAGANLGRSIVPEVFDTALRVLQRAGLSPAVSLSGVLTIFAYTLAAAFDAQTDPFHPPVEARPGGFVALRGVIDPARLPTLAATLDDVARATPQRDRTTDFADGLRLILAGMGTSAAQDAR